MVMLEDAPSCYYRSVFTFVNNLNRGSQQAVSLFLSIEGLDFACVCLDMPMCVLRCRACASAFRRCQKYTDQTGVRPERTGPSSCSPHRTSESPSSLFPFFLFQICCTQCIRWLSDCIKRALTHTNIIIWPQDASHENNNNEGCADCVHQLVNRKDRFLSFHREGLHQSIDHHLPNNKLIFFYTLSSCQ